MIVGALIATITTNVEHTWKAIRHGNTIKAIPEELVRSEKAVNSEQLPAHYLVIFDILS